MYGSPSREKIRKVSRSWKTQATDGRGTSNFASGRSNASFTKGVCDRTRLSRYGFANGTTDENPTIRIAVATMQRRRTPASLASARMTRIAAAAAKTAHPVALLNEARMMNSVATPMSIRVWRSMKRARKKRPSDENTMQNASLASQENATANIPLVATNASAAMRTVELYWRRREYT